MKQKRPTIEEIRKRWSRSSLPEMLFSGHVREDIEVLLEKIDSLERSVEHFVEQEAGEAV
jgi:hypothetical protein